MNQTQESDEGPLPFPQHSSGDTDDPLLPTYGTERDAMTPENHLGFSPAQLGKLVKTKDLTLLKILQETYGLERWLMTDLKAGLSLDERTLEGRVPFQAARGSLLQPAAEDSMSNRADLFSDRKRIFGDNYPPRRKLKTFPQLMGRQFGSRVLLLLIACAVLRVGLDLYGSFELQHGIGNLGVYSIEGVAIIVVVLIGIIGGSFNDWQKERQWEKLRVKKDDRVIKVMRSGKINQLSSHDVLVGDVVYLKPGDMILADGVYISGHGIICNETSASGELEQIRKVSAEEAVARFTANSAVSRMFGPDPFMISGATVLRGTGTYVVTAVGVHTFCGKSTTELHEDTTTTLYEIEIDTLMKSANQLGGGLAFLLFVVLSIGFLLHLKHSKESPVEKAQDFMRITITATTLGVVAVPVAITSAATRALAFTTRRMLNDGILVRKLDACETMADTVTICSNMSCIMTRDNVHVRAGTIGVSHRFGTGDSLHGTNHHVPTRAALGRLPSNLKDLLRLHIALNFTGYEGETNGNPTFIGSRIETAMLDLGRDYLGMGSIAEERSNVQVIQMIPFDSDRKSVGFVIKLTDGRYRMLVSGGAEVLFPSCTRVVDVHGEDSNPSIVDLTPKMRQCVNKTINTYATCSLRTIGLVYRDFDSTSWPPQRILPLDDDPTMVAFDDLLEEITWIGIFGIENPLREGVSDAITKCRGAGVSVRMVTGENVFTAKKIAAEVGIYTMGAVVMDGAQFRMLSGPQMQQVLPNLQVLARATPDDKKILAQQLKNSGETVLMTGSGASDRQALITADVSLAMGNTGTESAREVSSAILMDDNFLDIVKALMHGRALNLSLNRFLQFRLTVTITTVVLTFISTVAPYDGAAVLSAVQLLLINLAADTLAAHALVADLPATFVPKPDVPCSASMWKATIGQVMYQLAGTLALTFAGPKMGFAKGIQTRTGVFNMLIWMQIFNHYNNFLVDNEMPYEINTLTRNWRPIGSSLFITGSQILIVVFGGEMFSVVPLDGNQWGISVGFSALSLIVAAIIRRIPTEPMTNLAQFIFGFGDSSGLQCEEHPEGVHRRCGCGCTWPNAERSFWIMAASGMILIPIGMVAQQHQDAQWGLLATWLIWGIGFALLVKANLDRAGTTSPNFLLYLGCVAVMIAFSVLVAGLQPELLYIYLPLLIDLGIAAAYGLESLVKALWVRVTYFFDIVSDFSRFRRSQHANSRPPTTGEDVALGLLQRSG